MHFFPPEKPASRNYKRRQRRYLAPKLDEFKLNMPILMEHALDWCRQGLKGQMEISMTGLKFQIGAKEIKLSLQAKPLEALLKVTVVSKF